MLAWCGVLCPGKDHSCSGVTASVIEREALDVGELGAATASKGGADSLFVIDPPLEGATTDGLGIMALVPHGEKIVLGEDSLV
jgi:hypothetical protein